MRWPALGLWLGMWAAPAGAAVALQPPLDGVVLRLGSQPLQVAGITVPGATVALSLDGTLAQEMAADAEGAFAFTPLELPHGVYRLAVSIRAAGVLETVEREVTVDRQPPPLRLAAPWEALPAVVAECCDAVSGVTEPGAVVTVRLGGADLQAVADADGRFRLALPEVKGGQLELVVIARDAAGNETRLVRAVRLDPLPPVLLLLAPASETPISSAEVPLRARAEPGSTVRLLVNGREVPLECGADGAIAAVLPLTEGENRVVLEASDEAGNRTVVGQRLVRDTTAPSLLLAPPWTSAALRTADARLRVTGQTEPGRLVAMRVNGRRYAAIEADGDGRFVATGELADGRNSIQVATADAAGNQVVVERQAVLDRQPPLVQILSPGPVDYIETPVFTLRGRSEPGAQVALRSGQGKLDAVVDPFGGFVVADIPLTDGYNSLVLTVADDLGNTSVIPVNVAARLSMPHLELLAPGEGNQAAGTIEAQVVYDADLTLTAWLDGEPLGGWRSAGSGARREATRTLAGLPPGDHELRVMVRSASGLRQATTIRRFHLPGAVRAISLNQQRLSVRPGNEVDVVVRLADVWGAPVADGTIVLVELPPGWTVGGSAVRAPLALLSQGGVANLRLGALPSARGGLLVVRAGRFAEAYRLEVGR